MEQNLKTSDFYYDLPPHLIAQSPLENRSDSRLLVVDKSTGDLEHKRFYDIVDYLNSGDCLVINDTKVIPARLIGERLGAVEGKGAKIELLLLTRKENDVWETLARPGKKVKPGDVIAFGGVEVLLKAEILSVVSGGIRLVKLIYDGVFEQILDKLGDMPLPPYIKEKLTDKNRYQTVYAKEQGSAAAPTAGLHFTEEILDKIKAKGVKIAEITLHVGLGTFRPVKVTDIAEHEMHSEFYNIPSEEAAKINETRNNGGRIIAVGTTSARTLETASNGENGVNHSSGWTNIFIYPPYKLKVVDALITNFHLPESTLIMLVSALAERENILNAYTEAVKQEYRFFSFGDAMFIV